MGEVTEGFNPLDMRRWGPGITDFRHFPAQVIPKTYAEERYKTWSPNWMTPENAAKVIQASVDAAPPGVIFVGNPWRQEYSQWLIALRKFGFQPVSNRCSINFVMCSDRDAFSWRGKRFNGTPLPDRNAANWESPDGYGSWEHVLYFVKEPVPTLSFDFSDRVQHAGGGDHENTPWHINYGGRIAIKEYRSGNRPGFRWEPQYARLSKNCGIAMGFGPVTCGDELTKEFFTVMAIPSTEKLPTGWTRFLIAGGLKFGHNMKHLLETSQVCPHVYEF